MNLAIDVQYDGDSATVAGVLFEDWCSDKVFRTIITTQHNVKPYEPGAFYKRELPCILSLLDKVQTQLQERLSVIVIDGFVTLGSEQSDGLGMHLYRAVNESIPIIGVAKKKFADTPTDCEIYRGASEKPLLVTSVGMTLLQAKQLINGMHGQHRHPTLLKRADQVCRGIT